MKPEYKLLLNFENWQEIYTKRPMQKLQEDVMDLHEKISRTFGREVILHLFKKGISEEATKDSSRSKKKTQEKIF